MRDVYVFGNGNISCDDFFNIYAPAIHRAHESNPRTRFHVCDFRGVDTLTMEFLKHRTPSVTVYHVGKSPRYLPDRFNTLVSAWTINGGHASDKDRDAAAVSASSQFLAADFNSTADHTTATARSIRACVLLGKQNLLAGVLLRDYDCITRECSMMDPAGPACIGCRGYLHNRRTHENGTGRCLSSTGSAQPCPCQEFRLL